MCPGQGAFDRGVGSVKLSTKAVHAGRLVGDGEPVVSPIAISAAYGYDSVAGYVGALAGTAGRYVYSGDASPNSEELECAIADLESGEAAVAVPSGMAAMAFTCLALVKANGRIVVSRQIFGGSRPFFTDTLATLGLPVIWVDVSDMDQVRDAFNEPWGAGSVLICDSISNPLLQVVDLGRLAGITHSYGARLVVDNTLATPIFCRPLTHGADAVVHSLSKYLSGHSDVVGGIAVGASSAMASVREFAIRVGSRLDPFTSWLALRGVRTLPLRVERAASNAQTVAHVLRQHRAVSRVYYPEMLGRSAALKVLTGGFGAIVSFDLGTEADALRFVNALRLIRFVGSLGDVTTTVNHPASTSHRHVSEATRRDLGITAGLVRLSVGIEDVADILQDIEAALLAVVRSEASA